MAAKTGTFKQLLYLKYIFPEAILSESLVKTKKISSGLKLNDNMSEGESASTFQVPWGMDGGAARTRRPSLGLGTQQWPGRPQ